MSAPQERISFPVGSCTSSSQSLGKCEPELDAENEIAASAATKSTLLVDDICGDAADDILTAFGLWGRISSGQCPDIVPYGA